MTRWVMLADLERCVGCQTCTAACRHANATSPAVQWRKVLDVEAGSYPNVSRTFVPVGCQHCEDPPCMHVCPSTATRRRADGIVTIDYDICIGCAYCDVACPYQARFKIDDARFAYGAAIENEVERADSRLLGVAQKCTFCVDRIDFGLANGLTPGSDPRATPACVNACIADALHFGDLDDPDSNVSRLLREQRHFRMHEEIGTEPGFYYLYAKADGSAEAPGTSASAAPAPIEAGRIRSRGVEPWHQQHWDWKAAGNFICGGLGSGLLLFAALASLAVGSSSGLEWPALGLIALGLFLVLLKIGRPWRFIHVLRQPQRSWMTREAWVAAVLFPVGALAGWFDEPALLLAAAVLGLFFLLSQAMILREAKGVPAWRSPQVVPLILITGLAEGSGLLLVAGAALPVLAPMLELAAAAAVVLAALRALLWGRYRAALRTEGAPKLTLAVLDAFGPWFLAIGLVLPTAFIVLALLTGNLAAGLLPIAGLCIAGAGAALKFVLVTRAGYNQGFALVRTPVRGTGVAGPGIKPGW